MTREFVIVDQRDEEWAQAVIRMYDRIREMLTERAELEAKVLMLEDENAKLKAAKAAVERLIERHALLLAQVLDE